MHCSRIAVAIVVAACHVEPAPVEPPIAATPGSAAAAPHNQQVTLAAVGLEPASIDRTADPCVDFFQFACGGWLAHGEIPADRASWSRWAEIDEHNKLALHTLLEADANSATDPIGKKLGDYYASCMDTATIDKAGIAPIKPLLAKMTGVSDARSWFAALVELHNLGTNAVFATYTNPDDMNSSQNVLQLESGDLELPDRDYYLLPEFKNTVAAFRVHVGKMLALAGARHGADDVLAIETAIAKLSKTAVEQRDFKAAYNPTDASGLAAQVKSIDWDAYWAARGVSPSRIIVINTPKFFAQLDALHAKFKPAQWASYFEYKLLSSAAFSLGAAVDNEDFELQKVVSGVTARPERFKRCISETQTTLGELLGQQYVAAYFPGASKQIATKLVDAVFAAVADDIATADWLSPPTKAAAAAKLAKLVRRVGFPDGWLTYDFAVARDDFAGNELRAWAFTTHRNLARAGTPVDPSRWDMNAFRVNAYYSARRNNIAIPAGILQPPLFGANRSMTVNLGSIGWVIGHELTHGFDDQGAQFDAVGNRENWWQPEDKAKFEAKGTCVVDQYAAYEELPKQFVNGKLTLGENIADLGGIKAAYRAYRTLRAGATQQIADGFTEDQQFFLAIGQGDCTKNRPEEIKRLLTVDPHSPAELRLTGPLRDMPEFADAFHCAAGTPMHPATTCAVW
ncbi:MAG TPA: M13 family metallopeptidase [Kofleriaceae bacterium]|jgi:putative endopeptidase